MKHFKLNQATKPNVCDARRCGKTPQHTFTNGLKLCERHFNELTMEERDGLADVGSAENPNEKIQQYVDPIKTEYISMADQLKDYEIPNEDAAETVAEILTDTHNKIKEIDAKRKTITKPILEAKRAADALFKPAINALEEVKVLLKGKLTTFTRQQEEARKEALESGDVSQALATPEPQAPEGVATRRVWTFEVTDAEAIPREYLILDTAEVKEEMKRKGPENVEIPGIRIYQETKVVMGR